MNQMGFVIACFVIGILLIGAYAVARVHANKSRIGADDVITDFANSRRKKIEGSGAKISLNLYFLLLLICPIGLGVVTVLALKNSVAGILLGVMGLFLPDLLVNLSVRSAKKKFEERYLDALEQLGESLRAGESVSQAVDDVIVNPIIDEGMRAKFATVASDLKMGISASDAFRKFAEGTPGRDAKDVAMAIEIEGQIGGHEADAIREITENIRDRIHLRKELKSLFSSTSSMVTIMSIIPIAMMLVLTFGMDATREYYFSSVFHMGIFVLLYAIPFLGSFFIRRKMTEITKGVDDL